MKQKFSSALSLALIMAMLFTTVGLADGLSADADDLVLVAPNGNSLTVTQASGTTATYDFSAAIKDTGNDKDNVFPGAVIVSITSSGSWVSSLSSSSFEFTGYQAPQGGYVTIDVPCGSFGTSQTVTVNLNAGASTNSKTLSPASATLSYIVHAGQDDSNCTPSDTTPPSASPTQFPLANANGWNNSDVTVNWNWADNAGGSGIDSTNCTTSSISSSEGEITLNATCKDIAGNTGTASHTVKVDKSGPTVSASADPIPNGNGWNNTDVTVSYDCSDNGPSGVDNAASDLGDDILSASGDASGTCVDLAGNSASVSYSALIDKDAPTASATAEPAANGYGWNNTSVTVSYSGDDGSGSGIDFCDADDVLFSEGAGQTASGTCTDKAGNVSAPATATINIDLTNPLVSLIGGPANGGTYYFGFVPAAPTCDASDALSGLDGACSVSGYSAATGSHTVTASATDKAENSASDTASYNVSAWTLKGFYNPVDMNGVYNLVKGGSTVPLKFEVFAGPTELTATSVVTSFVQTKVACDGTSPTDEIEVVTTGGTSLRYDATGGQFIQNWQTPKQSGACYRVTMTTQDGSYLQAFFKLK